MIGSLGEVVFEVSESAIRTFDEYKRSGTGRWTAHEVIGQKPVLEFLGPDLEQISFTIRLDVALGLNPGQELAALRALRDGGRAVTLMLAGYPVTTNQWVVESLNESVTAMDNRGNILTASVEVALKEYVSR